MGLRWLYDEAVHPDYLRGRVDPAGIACWYVRRGKVTVLTRQQACSAVTGEWIFPARQDARQEITPGSVLISLRIDAGPPESVWPVPRDTTVVLPKEKGRHLRRLAEDLARACAHGAKTPHDALSAWTRQRALITWVMEAVRLLHASAAFPRAGAMDSRIAAMLTWVREPGRKLSISALARAVGLSPSQVNRLLTQATGKTARRWWEDARWRRIEAALRNPEASPKSIALDHGFPSLSTFSRWVRRQTGKSPRAWRNT